MKNLFCALLLIFWGELTFGQPFPEEPEVLGRHPVRAVTFSPDGKWLAAGGWDNTIHLYDVKARQKVAELKGHNNWVTSLAFSSDSSQLASGSWDDTIRLWDVVAQKEAAIMQHPGGVNSVAFSPDSNWLASVGINLRLWDVKTHKEVVGIPQAHNASIKAVTFSPNGKLLATGSIDHRIQLWDMAAPEQGVIPKEFIQARVVMSIAFSHDSRWLAEGNWGDGVVRIWDVETKKEVAIFPVPPGSLIHSVAFSPDSRWLAAARADNDGRNIWLWNVEAQKEVAVSLHPGGAFSVAFSPDGRWLASGGVNAVLLWKLDSSVSVQPQGKLPTTLGEIKRKVAK